MRPDQVRPLLFQQFLKYLPVGQSLIDFPGDDLADVVRHAAAVGVAAGQRIEVAGATVASDLAGAIDAGEKPLDPLRFVAWPVQVGRQLGALYFKRRRWHLE